MTEQVIGGDIEGDGRDNKGEDVRLATRYGESGDMIKEDGGSGDTTEGIVGQVVISRGDDKVGEDGGE